MVTNCQTLSLLGGGLVWVRVKVHVHCFGTVCGVLRLRTDPLMDANAPLQLKRISPQEHANIVQSYARQITAAATAAAVASAETARIGEAGVASESTDHHAAAVAVGHDKSNSFGRQVAASMPRFRGSALVQLAIPTHTGGDGGGVCTVSVEPGMSMDQLFAATEGCLLYTSPSPRDRG